MSRHLDSTDFWVLFAMILALALIIGIGDGVQIRRLQQRIKQLEQRTACSVGSQMSVNGRLYECLPSGTWEQRDWADR